MLQYLARAFGSVKAKIADPKVADDEKPEVRKQTTPPHHLTNTPRQHANTPRRYPALFGLLSAASFVLLCGAGDLPLMMLRMFQDESDRLNRQVMIDNLFLLKRYRV